MRTLEGLFRSQARAVKLEITLRLKRGSAFKVRAYRAHDALRLITQEIETIAKHPDYHMDALPGISL